jgi:acetyl-CoA synthetase
MRKKMTKTAGKLENERSVQARFEGLERLRGEFDWSDAMAELDGLPGGGFNIAHEAVDRHATSSRGQHVAIRWLAKTGEITDITYANLKEQSDRFASALADQGLGKGDRIFVLSDRIPELYITALAVFKIGAVFCPMFAAFGPEPIKARMTIGGAKALITTSLLYQRKVAKIRDDLPYLEHVIVVGETPDTHSFHDLLHTAPPGFTIASTGPEDRAILHFTSGTTGTPKGAVHVHQAALGHYATAKYALDLHPDDIFWCTADPGWVTGTSYGIIAPLMVGATMVVDQQEFDAQRWYQTLQDQKVTVWYTAPTAIRMLMKLEDDVPKQFDLSALRFVASVGEPLNPEAVRWGFDVLGKAIHDNWWQTETGGIMIANAAALPIKPGSMGVPVPGIEAAIIEHNEEDGLTFITEPDTEGELVLRAGWPSMFRAYLDQDERYQRCFRDGWYLSGDLARRDEDGYYWFVGRADDVIKSAGHLIGPFEVESALVEHEAVIEAAVIGLPDEISGEIVKAYVTLKEGYTQDDVLLRDLMAHARKHLGPAIAPRQIEFRDSLPKTRSGKIMRRLLKAQELGLPTGDVSTLETYA